MGSEITKRTVAKVAPMSSSRTSSGNRVEEKAKPSRKVIAARIEPEKAIPAAASPDWRAAGSSFSNRALSKAGSPPGDQGGHRVGGGGEGLGELLPRGDGYEVAGLGIDVLHAGLVRVVDGETAQAHHPGSYES